MFETKKIVYKNITSNGIDVKNNKVGIVLKDNSKSEQENFTNLLMENSDMSKARVKENFTSLLNFDQGNINKMSNVNAGSSIGICTMGFRVKYNGKEGYVTAGHCLTDPSRINGIVRFVRFADHWSGDYGFVEANEYTGTLTNKLNITTPSSSKLAVVRAKDLPRLAVGTIVSKCGAITGFNASVIQKIHTTAYYWEDNVTIYELVKTDLAGIEKGDSGSPVFLPRKDSDGGAIPMGVLSGGDSYSMYFTDINYMPEFNDGRY